jgi:acetyl-CoA carboxylase carboxyltransferase component
MYQDSARVGRPEILATHSGEREAGYHWITLEQGSQFFLKPVFDALECRALRLWVDADVTAETFQRTCCGGLITAVGAFKRRAIAIAWSDFRVMGASYGRANSQRFAAFLQHLREPGNTPTPLIYFVNSAGVSLMEGRAIFSDAFALWPELLAYSERNPLFTCAVGKCLGLAPLLFGLGHYRVGVAARTQINLTGPEVIELFFGNAVDFAHNAAAERFHDCNDLVHEIVQSTEAAFARFKGLLSGDNDYDIGGFQSIGEETGHLLGSFLDSAPQEIIPGWSKPLRVFLGTRHGKQIGVFINPLERSDNMITVRTLEKYAAALDLFRALGVPNISFLDSPGIDPRFDQSDANNFRKMLAVGERIIRYPHGAMGVVTRRCFGGAATLGFPKVFGGMRAVALRGSRIGCMHESIIERQLSGTPRLLAQWKEVAARQGPEMEDLIDQGSVDAVIDPLHLPGEIDAFLDAVDTRFNIVPVRRRAV